MGIGQFEGNWCNACKHSTEEIPPEATTVSTDEETGEVTEVRIIDLQDRARQLKEDFPYVVFCEIEQALVVANPARGTHWVNKRLECPNFAER